MSEICASSQTDFLKRISKICESFDFAAAIFDSNLECVYSKDIDIKLKAKADLFLKEFETFEKCDFTETMFVVKGVQYCAKITRIDDYYVCALFDSRGLGKIARNTDFFDRFLPIVNAIEYNYSHLWGIVSRLKNSGNEAIAVEMEKYLSKANQLTHSTFEYMHIICREPNPVRIDCGDLLRVLVKRTNTILANCGRSIELVAEDDCIICADKRHLISAVVSAIQNALLYSPKDCVPIITLSKCKLNGKEYVIFKAVNENIGYVEEGKKLYENIYKIGAGIPMIKHFIEETNGEFVFDEISDKVMLVMKIPAAAVYKNKALFFECDEYSYYDTGIPDFLELQMREVVDLFKENI